MTPSQPLPAESADATPASVVDISSFKRRRKYLLLAPALLQIASALIIVNLVWALARLAGPGLLVTGVLLGSGMFSHAFLTAIIGSVTAIAFTLICACGALIGILGYRALAQSSIWSFGAATVLLILGYVSLFRFIEGAWAPSDDVITLVVWVAGIFLIQTAIARTVFSDFGGWILWRGPPVAPTIANLHRYGGLSRTRFISNIRKLVLRLSGPILVGALLCGVQVLFFFAAPADGRGFLASLLSSLAVIFIARPFFANQLWRAIRRFKVENAETAATIYELDKRPRILLLRSFHDDSIEVPYRRSLSQAIFGLKLHHVRLEEAIVEVAYRYGPVGALQDPNAHLKPLGAARDLATNQNWQSRIRNALHDASVVIMVLGLTPGLRWELHTIRELGFLNKTIFIFPPADRADVNTIRQIVRELLPSVDAVWNDKYQWPLMLFSDESGRWHLTISDHQAEQDYRHALLLAIEFGSHATMPASRRKFGRSNRLQTASGLSRLTQPVAALVTQPSDSASISVPGAFQAGDQKAPQTPLLHPAPEKPGQMKWLPWVGTAILIPFFASMVFKPASWSDSTSLDVHKSVPEAAAELKEERPPIGYDQLLSEGQLRYCLAENIRLQAQRSHIQPNDGPRIDRFNKMIDDYHSRCNEGLAYDLESAKEDVSRRRLELEAEGRSRN